MIIDEQVNECDSYIDYEFYLDDHTDGCDWKAFVFFDKEAGEWANVTYSKSKSEGKIEPFDETEDVPPTELTEWVKNFLEKKKEVVEAQLLSGKEEL